MNIKRHIFELIVDHHRRWKHQPSRSGIRGFFSTSCVDVDLHLEQLEREGLLSLGADGESIKLTSLGTALRLIKLPNGPQQSRLDQHHASPDSITIDLRAAGINMDGDLFAQVVTDDSMIDAGIRKEDIAILRAGAPARGEIVAVERSGALVLRRFIIIKNIPHLLAENRTQLDLSVAFDVPLLGIVCCVISPKVHPAHNSEVSVPTKITYTPKKLPAGNSDRWPVPPSGISLNDAVRSAYPTGRRKRRSTLSEQPDQSYGHAPTQAPAERTCDQRKREAGPDGQTTDGKQVEFTGKKKPKHSATEVSAKEIRGRQGRAFLRV